MGAGTGFFVAIGGRFEGMHAQAAEAFKAMHGRKAWGKFAAFRYAQKKGIVRLYVLAQQLEALHKAGY